MISVLIRRLSSVMLALLLLGAVVVNAAPLEVEVVLSEEGAGYREFLEALRTELKGSSVTISNAQGAQPSSKSDLIIAVGSKAAKASAASSTPVLYVLISREAYMRLQHDYPRQAGSSSAIFLDQPMERQLSVLKRTFPNMVHIGVIYAHAAHDFKALRNKIAEHGLVLHEQEIVGDNTLPLALQAVLKQSEVILALPDGDVYNAGTIRNILLATYRAQVPIVGFSASFVRAGAACGIYSTPTQIAKQAAETTRQFANGQNLPAAQYAREFEVQINRQVIQSLGLNIPPQAELETRIEGKN